MAPPAAHFDVSKILETSKCLPEALSGLNRDLRINGLAGVEEESKPKRRIERWELLEPLERASVLKDGLNDSTVVLLISVIGKT